MTATMFLSVLKTRVDDVGQKAADGRVGVEDDRDGSPARCRQTLGEIAGGSRKATSDIAAKPLGQMGDWLGQVLRLRVQSGLLIEEYVLEPFRQRRLRVRGTGVGNGSFLATERECRDAELPGDIEDGHVYISCLYQLEVQVARAVQES